MPVGGSVPVRVIDSDGVPVRELECDAESVRVRDPVAFDTDRVIVAVGWCVGDTGSQST